MRASFFFISSSQPRGWSAPGTYVGGGVHMRGGGAEAGRAGGGGAGGSGG